MVAARRNGHRRPPEDRSSLFFPGTWRRGQEAAVARFRIISAVMAIRAWQSEGSRLEPLGVGLMQEPTPPLAVPPYRTGPLLAHCKFSPLLRPRAGCGLRWVAHVVVPRFHPLVPFALSRGGRTGRERAGFAELQSQKWVQPPAAPMKLFSATVAMNANMFTLPSCRAS
jgi:hypothetical protein